MRYKSLYIALLGLSALSCDLFSTRDPENPVSDNQTLATAFTKEVLFSNFISSFEQKNIQEYEKLFADTATHSRRFTFVPNQSAGARFVAVFSSWDKTAEIEYFRNAVTAVGTSSSMQMQAASMPVIVTYQSDSAQYTFDYLLFVPHNRSDVKTTQFAGRCEIAMAPDKNTIWRIYRWIDYETKKDSSWSDLKGQFSK